MCWFKKKSRQEIATYQKNEVPPEPSIRSDAEAVLWSEDKKCFCEIYFEYGCYKYNAEQLYYDDFIGYYWSPMPRSFASFFDTFDRAKKAAEYFLQGIE